MFGLGINRLGTSTSRLEGAISGLFKNGEAGVWYDPSDVEASLTWRRNLLEYTESFDVSPWQKVNIGGTAISVIPSTHQAPDGSYNGVQILGLDTNQDRIDQATGIPAVANKTYTYSVWLRGSGVIKINVGTSTGVGGSTEATVNLTSTWTRYSVTNTFNSAPTGNLRVHGVITRVTGTAPEVHAFGAQLEEGSTATEYQPIRTTFDNAFKQAFPKHTLYQDEKGTTPVTGLGQAVGIMLDKSQGLQFGEESVVNGTFDNNINGWTVPSGSASTITHSNGALSGVRNNEDVAVTTLSSSVVAGKTYRLEFDVVSKSSENGWVYFVIGTNFTEQNTVYGKSLGKKIYTFVANNNTSDIYLRAGGVGGLSLVVDNISLKEIKGSHATQSDSTKRPVFARHPERGRVNLFKYTEEFDNGFWSKYRVNISSGVNALTAPDGTNTAEKMTATANNGSHAVEFSNNYGTDTHTQSIYAKAGEYSYLVINGLQSGDFTYFNLSNGTIGSIATPHTNVTMTDAGNGWYRCSVTHAGNNSGAGFGVAQNDGGQNFTGDGSSGIYIWGAQLEVANEATGYQKVVDDYDITESGYKSVYYLQFDGVNDGMQINNLTSSATPITALFGVELNANNKWLLDIQSGRTVFGGNSSDHSIFDGSWINGEPEVLNTPIVLTYDAVQSDLKIRTNGIVETTSSAHNENAIGGSIGLFQSFTQNGSYVNGNMYQVVLRAAESTDKEIDQAEEFVAIKTGLKSEVVGLATLDLNFGANTYTARNSNGSVL